MKDYIEIRWCIDDVRAVAQDEFDMSLSDEDCLEILKSIQKNHDASIGVNWGVIGAEISAFKLEPKTKEYRVSFVPTESLTYSFTVEASSEEEAGDIALQDLRESIGWDASKDFEFDDVEEV